MNGRRRRHSTGQRWIAGLIALVTAGATTVIAGTTAAAVIQPATLSIEKTGPAPADLPLSPGEPFNYVVTVQCSYPIPNSGCYDAQVTDTIPAPFELAGTPTVVSNGNSATVTTSGNDVTVDFDTTFLNTTDPGSGMLGGTTATITIPVVVPEDADYDFSGTDIVNTADFSASNPDTAPVDDDHAVQIDVELDPETDVTKSFDPAEATASAGTPTTIEIDATNESGTGVDSLVITDPAPGSGSTTFDYLQLDSITITDVPAGADELVVSVDTGSGLEPVGPAIDVSPPAAPYVIDLSGVDLEAVEGIQIEFTDTEDPRIEDGASAGVDIGMVQRDPGALSDDVTVTNTAGSEVSRDGEPGSDTDDATYDITTNVPTVSAGKTFDPDQVLHGESSTATITAGVEGDIDVETLTVTEPSAGSFSEAMSFEGFDGPIVFPEGADSATITFQTTGGPVTTDPFASGEDPTPLPDPATVTSFAITFEDTDDSGIVAGGTEASIPIAVGTDPTDTAEVTELDNPIDVTGTTEDGVNGSASGEDTLYVFDEHIDPTATKSITPSSILGFDGEWVVMQLSGGTAGLPVDGETDVPYSSIPSQQIVVQDPVDPSAADPFWDAFDPTQLTDIDIPADAELTVNYWDGDSWETLTGPLDSSQSPFSYDIAGEAPPAPEDIGGLQFQYDYVGADDGFPPGTSFQPNVVMDFDVDAADTSAWESDDPAQFTNCANASAAAGTTGFGPSDPACADVDVLEPDADGGGPTMDKTFVNADGSEDPSIPARSHQTTTARLHWSTGGMSDVDSVTLTDEDGAPPGDLATSVFDAFDLVQIDAIDGSLDPLMEYDAIDAVLIYRDDLDAWVVPTDSPCGPLDDGGGAEFTAACAGAMPAIALTDEEQAQTVGVQIVYVEYPGARGDALAPPVGSGVARSTDADGRDADLTMRVRDWRRSVLPGLEAVDSTDTYNAGDAGLVGNTASAVSDMGGTTTSVDDGAEIVITGPDLDVATTKTWDGSPVGVPPTSTDPGSYPNTAMSLTVTNGSSIVYVDELRIVDRPTEGRPADDPQVLMPDVFDITSIDAVTMPIGADEVTVTAFDDAGVEILASTDADGAGAVAWTEAQLANVVGFELLFSGRVDPATGGPGDPTTGGIEPSETGGIDLSLRLRQEDRYRSVPIDDAYLETYGVEDPITGDYSVPVDNASVGSVDDAGRVPAVDPEPPTDDAEASVDLTVFEIGVAVDKEFSDADGANAADPYVQVETVDGSRPEFRMTLTGTPIEGARPISMQVSDLDASFWNAYEFVGIDPSFTLASPIETVEMQVCTGPALAGDLGDATISGGCERAVAGDDSVTYSGTLESSGPTSVIPTLPTDVDAEDVIGLIFTFSSATAWENPWNPVQEIPIIVQRRETMLTPAGSAPPTDLDGNQAAPGEAAAGTWENTTQGAITALLDEAGATGDGIHGVAEDVTADVTYAHSVTAAEVVKTPDGSGPLSLAASTPFSLTFTNTGDTPIYNPVFTDELPVNADGPVLLVDPSPAATGGSPYAFALDTAGGDPLPAGWAPVPTDEAQITITPDPAGDDTTEIEFAFPDGVALGVGESYTITIQMLTQAGLSPDEFFTNTAVIDGDRPFDYCAAPPFDPDDAEVLDTCEGDATNSVAAGGALRSGKFVRAGTEDEPSYDLGEINVIDPGAECEPYTGTFNDGFFALPCVPRTAPGQTETWRLVLRNTGNVPLSQIIAVDRLPAVGDATALNPGQSRGSLWAPVLTTPLAGSGGATGVTLTEYVTEDEVPCTDVINHTGDCDGSWIPLEDFTGDVADITGSMYIADFAPGSALEPGGVVWIDVETTTPATAPSLTDPDTATADPIAWNTVATSATTEDGTDLLATEGNAAGVALATGALEFNKVVIGEGADGIDPDFAPDDFDVTVVCTSLDEEVFRTTFTVTGNGPAELVDNLPYGAECTLEETDQGQYTVALDPETVTIPDGSAVPVQITITNDYPLASLRLTKEVLQGDSTVDPEDAGPFTLAAICRFQGDVVFASNTSDYTVVSGTIMAVEGMTHDDSIILEGLPAGAECIAGELDAAGADRVGVIWTTATAGSGGTVVGDPDDGPVASDLFALTPDDDDAPLGPTTNDVLVLNQYAQGQLEIIKELDGPGASAHLGDTFTVEVTCVFERPDDEGGDVVTFDGAVDVVVGTPTVIDGIIVGSVCDVTEPESGRNGADQWIFDPAAPDGADAGQVVIDTDTAPVTLTVTNVFETLVDLDVTKIVDADPLNDGQGGVPDVGPFPVAVTCVYAEGTPYEQVIYSTDAPATNELLDGDVWLVEDMPTGTVCTVTETDAAGAIGTTVEAENADGSTGALDGTSTTITLTPNGVLGGTTNHVTFVNDFPVGSLALEKVLTGDGAADRGAGPFTLHVECTSPTFGADTWSGDVIVGGTEPLTATIDGILAPSLCTVTEVDDGGADAVFFEPALPGARQSTVLVTADAQAPVTVTVTNHFEPLASLEVTKVVEDTIADETGAVPDLGPYAIAVECIYDPGGPNEHEVYADGHGLLRPMVALLDDGETATYTGIPATSVCTVTELVDGGAVSSTVTVANADGAGEPVDGTAGAVAITPNDDADEATTSVVVTNAFDAGSLALVKELAGDPEAYADAGPFTFSIECTLARAGRGPAPTYTGELILGGGQPLVAGIDGIVAGSECVITEVDTGGADEVALSPAGSEAGTAVVTIAAGTSVSVTAVNTFEADAVLPLTGFDGWWLVAVAGALLVLGVILVVVRRRIKE
ncbi:DUF5979 domain-containing protein [Demequina sp. NBRC 110053]|uniref:DUF5979 domain-containing protein n=1 Tax=Demequina sp. NBRC 110053 TaxID=1570342 RepID=UPI0013566D9E|nr:DUF5979 domain-containing protein [Demequina sp. NBRC 110053]